MDSISMTLSQSQQSRGHHHYDHDDPHDEDYTSSFWTTTTTSTFTGFTNRWMQQQQEEEASSSPSPTMAPTTNSTSTQLTDPTISNTEMLVAALRVYGGILAIGLPIYCFLRIKYPKVFAVRQFDYSNDLKFNSIKTPIAKNQFGYIKWIYKVFTEFTDEQLLEEVGLDALCMLRVLYMGFKLAIVGCINSLWLFPIYITAPKSQDDPDALNKVAINVLETGSLRFIATVFGMYIFFGYFFYVLLDEFKWFIRRRHMWLSKFNVRNYTVFVRNIPIHMRSSTALKQHFELIYGEGSVLQANMVLHVSGFSAAVNKRNSLVSKLNHALAEYAIYEKRPTHLAPYKEQQQQQQQLHQTEEAEEKEQEGGHGNSNNNNSNNNNNQREEHGNSDPWFYCFSKHRKKHFQRVDSIDYYTDQLNRANEDVSKRLDEIHRKNRNTSTNYRDSLIRLKTDFLSSSVLQHQQLVSEEEEKKESAKMDAVDNNNNTDDNHHADGGGDGENDSLLPSSREKKPSPTSTSDDYATTTTPNTRSKTDGNGNDDDDDDDSSDDDMNLSPQRIEPLIKALLSEHSSVDVDDLVSQDIVSDDNNKTAIKKLSKQASTFMKLRAKKALEILDKAEGVACTVLKNVAEEGKPDDAAFVTFNTLVATHGALQMSQYHIPYVLDTQVAPGNPEYVFWSNVGADREAIQAGQLISAVMTIVICLFWTIPVTAIVNFANVQYLRNLSDEMEAFIENNEWFVMFLSILSPVLLLTLNTGILPIVLKAVSRLEFPPSDSLLEASAFWKMCAFHIIQTFFVTLISGSIVQEIEKMLQNPSETINLLASSLPEQSAYFMQLLLVNTTMGALSELIRAVPLFQAFVRSLLGWKLTEKERSENIGMFKPLCVVDKFYYSRAHARFILYFLVMFTYTAISPLINWFCLVFFLFLGSVYRHQFIFNYPSNPDTGGEIWLCFIQVLLAVMIIAEVILAGFLGLKKAPTSLALLIPLIVFSAIFIIYLQKEHFHIGNYLPTRAALRKDLENDEQGVSFRVFADQYENPALLQRHADPDWDSGKAEALKRKGVQPIESIDPESPIGFDTNDSTNAADDSGKPAVSKQNRENLGVDAVVSEERES